MKRSRAALLPLSRGIWWLPGDIFVEAPRGARERGRATVWHAAVLLDYSKAWLLCRAGLRAVRNLCVLHRRRWPIRPS